MGSYATLTIGSLKLASSKSDWESLIMTLFTEEDKECGVNKDICEIDGEEIDGPEYYFYYTAPLYVIKDRLEVMGYTSKKAASIYEIARSKELSNIRQRMEEPLLHLTDEDMDKSLAEEEILESLTFEKWVEGIRYILENNFHRAYIYESYKDENYEKSPDIIKFILKKLDDGVFGYEIGDFRTYLRAIIESDVDTDLTYDLSEIVNSGYLEFDEDPNKYSRQLMADQFSINHKIVVLTEGSTDRSAIQGAFDLFYPHLNEYFSFMDFDGAKVQGSASSLALTVKSFIGAGIVNRIVALFDNDTAAKDAMRTLDGIKIPPNVKVFRYPDIDSARNYPTLGPQGTVSMDINGLACSLELYFGKDVLTRSDGSFYQIQWTGYVNGAKQYQGEILEKKTLQDRYAQKFKKCQSDPRLIDQYDWSGMRAIIEKLLTAFHEDDE